MLLAILAAVLIAPPVNAPATPDAVWAVSFVSLHDDTTPEDQPYTRFLYAPDDAAPYPQIIDYAANSTSFRSEFGHVEPIGGRILKLDLRAFAWDYGSRSRRLAELERRGVRFNFKDASERADFLDPWEALAKVDPYFEVGHYDSNHVYCPGWLDLGRVNAARQLTRSLKFVLRADWVLPRLLLEKKFNGIYSDLLMIPSKESDYYKSLLIDIKALERDNYLLKGGAVLGGGPGGVALHNRELQLLNGSYGYYWRTFDVNVDARGNKSVFESHRGTMVHDGREAFGQLPNLLLWWRLDDGKGDQAASVPDDIAQVKESPSGLPIRDTRVINSYQCLRCHLPNNGIYPFDDVIRKAFLSDPANLDARSKSPYAASELAAALEDYYSSKLGQIIERQRADQAPLIKQACGMTGREAAQEIVGAVESYLHELVDPAAYAREMGYRLDFAQLAWMASKNPQLAVLASGQPIRRAAAEQSFGDAMRSAVELKRRLGKSAKSDPY